MVINPRKLPDRPDYKAACRQTVTLYNKAPGSSFAVHRTVFEESAYLESRRNYSDSKTGVTASSPVLLVIPQAASGNVYVDAVVFDALSSQDGFWTMHNGDKAVRGVGPEIATATEWGQFISSKFPEVVTISAVDVKRNLTNEIVAVEGGGS